MELTLTTPALLFPAIAILMLGYINRYVGTTSVIRAFKKDYDSGYKHNEVVMQISILQKRIELFRYMLSVAISGLIFACLAMLFIFMNLQLAGKIVFGFALVAMVSSMILSLFETASSNKSLLIEINDILNKEAKK